MPAGRPTKYDPGYHPNKAYQLCLLGLNDEELAKIFDIAKSTLNEWKKEHEQFSDSVNAGKDLADAEIAESFHKRAKGYRYEEVTYEKIVLEDNKEDAIDSEAYRKRVVTKELPPDAGAALNWLKNRQPKKWRDKIDYEHGGKDGGPIQHTVNPATMSDEELRAAIADEQARLPK